MYRELCPDQFDQTDEIFVEFVPVLTNSSGARLEGLLYVSCPYNLRTVQDDLAAVTHRPFCTLSVGVIFDGI